MSDLPAGWVRPTVLPRGCSMLMTTRAGGVSAGRYASMNVGLAVGDAAGDVAINRGRLAAWTGTRPVFVRQVHGTSVVRVGMVDAGIDPEAGDRLEADAMVTTEHGVACVIQSADCLPVLLAAPGGRAVGAAHAGWRGLAGGVVEATVAAVCEAGDCRPEQLVAWLGACIGPTAFEVGADVVEAFEGAGPGPAHDPASTRFVATRPGKWLADLAGLARDRLGSAGVVDVSGGTWCTHGDPSRFFSYRRDGVTGRLAAAVWIDPRDG